VNICRRSLHQQLTGRFVGKNFGRQTINYISRSNHIISLILTEVRLQPQGLSYLKNIPMPFFKSVYFVAAYPYMMFDELDQVERILDMALSQILIYCNLMTLVEQPNFVLKHWQNVFKICRVCDFYFIK